MPEFAPLASVNGRILPLAEATVPALDRGFLFGDAVYEVLRVYNGKPRALDAHMERLSCNLKALQICHPADESLRQRIKGLCLLCPGKDALVYIQVTRGSAPRRHAFPAHSDPLEFLSITPFVDPYRTERQKGVYVMVQPDLRSRLCNFKTTNLLANVLANQAAQESGAKECLLVDRNGRVTEGSHTNLFAVYQDHLYTAPLSANILPGITRSIVLELALKLEIPIREIPLKESELLNADEAFLTGTATEVLPIARISSTELPGPVPGTVTSKLISAYAAWVQKDGNS